MLERRCIAQSSCGARVLVMKRWRRFDFDGLLDLDWRENWNCLPTPVLCRYVGLSTGVVVVYHNGNVYTLACRIIFGVDKTLGMLSRSVLLTPPYLNSISNSVRSFVRNAVGRHCHSHYEVFVYLRFLNLDATGTVTIACQYNAGHRCHEHLDRIVQYPYFRHGTRNIPRVA